MQKNSGRYNTSNFEEGECEPGSKNKVMKNLLHIKNKKEIDEIEFQAQSDMMEVSFGTFASKHRFKSKDIQWIHKLWLGKIYKWAGKYRQVNLSKDGFTFAAATLIPNLMEKFEKQELKKFTPCDFTSQQEIAHAIAVTHVELILIHPFRDGNGRIARALANLMASQAGLPPLNFGYIKGKIHKRYIESIHAGLVRNYEPLIDIFDAIIEKSIR